jgi:hypothetical protein
MADFAMRRFLNSPNAKLALTLSNPGSDSDNNSGQNNTFPLQLKFHCKFFLDIFDALNLMVPSVRPYLYPFSHIT